MKSKYFNLLALPALVVIAFCLFSGFSPQDCREAAMDLVEQRTLILQGVARGEIPRDEAKNQLRSIEAETLLKEDLDKLSDPSAAETGTAYSAVFREIKKKKQFFQYITYDADIEWDTGTSTFGALYNIVIKEEDGSYKLTLFEPVNL